MSKQQVTLQDWLQHHKFTGVVLYGSDDGLYIRLTVPEKPFAESVYLVRGNTMHRQLKEGTREHPAKYEGYKPKRVKYAGPAGMETRTA